MPNWNGEPLDGAAAGAGAGAGSLKLKLMVCTSLLTSQSIHPPTFVSRCMDPPCIEIVGFPGTPIIYLNARFSHSSGLPLPSLPPTHLLSPNQLHQLLLYLFLQESILLFQLPSPSTPLGPPFDTGGFRPLSCPRAGQEQDEGLY